LKLKSELNTRAKQPEYIYSNLEKGKSDGVRRQKFLKGEWGEYGEYCSGDEWCGLFIVALIGLCTSSKRSVTPVVVKTLDFSRVLQPPRNHSNPGKNGTEHVPALFNATKMWVRISIANPFFGWNIALIMISVMVGG